MKKSRDREVNYICFLLTKRLLNVIVIFSYSERHLILRESWAAYKTTCIEQTVGKCVLSHLYMLNLGTSWQPDTDGDHNFIHVLLH